MARRIPEHRFADLVECATSAFIANGYQRTQMAEIAAALGVAKGTLYGYVESKEALLALCLRHASAPGPVEQPDTLPIPHPRPGSLARELEHRARQVQLPSLAAALARPRAADIRAELESVLRELYDATEQNRVAITLVEKTADHPELNAPWQKQVREATRDQLQAYLESRSAAGQLRRFANAPLAARLVIEVIATWAMHIYWDPSPQAFDPAAARENAIDFLLRGLLEE